ncbi:MAG: hypothetical protein A2046_01660 [Bacteroidetes bacterium GWA2_30_7]|nr:MAG: hypothetical protein A2046_01660 [Bacteroidetes bacterium GWA2_30_7]
MIYSIGHANREFDDFISLLKTYEIEYLIDVRSSPYSKMFPVYNKEPFSNLLKQNGFTYVYLGDTLGGLPKDSSCYIEYTDKNNEDSRKIDYSKIEKKDFFKKGLERLKIANEKGLKVAVMCSELNPEECHRSKLIGLVLLKKGIIIQHINKFGKLIDQNEVNVLINKGKSPINLWGEIDMTSKRKVK